MSATVGLCMKKREICVLRPNSNEIHRAAYPMLVDGNSFAHMSHKPWTTNCASSRSV